MTPIEAATALEPMLRALIQGEYSSLSIAFNEEHAPNYNTAAEWAAGYSPGYSGTADDRIEWLSDDDRLKAIADNSVWTIQWYPNTPVGFSCVGASTLAGAVAAAIRMAKEP